MQRGHWKPSISKQMRNQIVAQVLPLLKQWIREPEPSGTHDMPGIEVIDETHVELHFVDIVPNLLLDCFKPHVLELAHLPAWLRGLSEKLSQRWKSLQEIGLDMKLKPVNPTFAHKDVDVQSWLQTHVYSNRNAVALSIHYEKESRLMSVFLAIRNRVLVIHTGRRIWSSDLPSLSRFLRDRSVRILGFGSGDMQNKILKEHGFRIKDYWDVQRDIFQLTHKRVSLASAYKSLLCLERPAKDHLKRTGFSIHDVYCTWHLFQICCIRRAAIHQEQQDTMLEKLDRSAGFVVRGSLPISWCDPVGAQKTR